MNSTADPLRPVAATLPTYSALAGIVGGECDAESAPPVSSVEIDSRRCTAGTLFFALPGETADGEQFVDAAASAGAVTAVVRHGAAPDGRAWPIPVVVVTDVLAALHRLATWYVDACLTNVTRIGITGSNGKTTTKELTVALLQAYGKTFGSHGNYNSETGLPLSVLGTPPDADFAVYEMAMSAPGEMEALASIVRPAIAIITNIGTAHIGRVGSRDAIAREKRAIATYFSGNETLVIPESDDYVDTLAADVNGRVVRFGPVAQAVTIEERGTDGVRLVWQDGREIMLPLSGRHNALNALAAIRLTDVLALDRFGADPFAGRLVLPDGRSQQIPLPSGGLIIHDAYNANPDSMAAALAMVAQIRADRYQQRRLVLILGEMYELGEQTGPAHREVFRAALRLAPDILCVVGDYFSQAAAAVSHRAGENGNGPIPEIVIVPSAESLQQRLPVLVDGTELIFLKGSRGVGLEVLIPTLRKGVTAGV
ncbi:MAG: UDP-N-acetylmuramoyl-tripeptide--D-alanyl-D-alanine ligase [Spirochaeta sp.]|nr:UDP-N-acetylmuramoyl-tripeptide--D-alanyl-D-alanine ligase [Spirochaeta sp.]